MGGHLWSLPLMVADTVGVPHVMDVSRVSVDMVLLGLGNV